MNLVLCMRFCVSCGGFLYARIQYIFNAWFLYVLICMLLCSYVLLILCSYMFLCSYVLIPSSFDFVGFYVCVYIYMFFRI